MSNQVPVRTRPSLEPVDLEAVAAIRERLEAAPVNAQEHAIDREHYSAMAIARENARPWEFVVVTEERAKRELVAVLNQQVALMKGIDPTFAGYSNPRYLLSTPVIVMPYGDIRATAGYPRHRQPPRPRRPLEETVHREVFDRSRVRTDEELVDFFYSHGVRGRGFR